MPYITIHNKGLGFWSLSYFIRCYIADQCPAAQKKLSLNDPGLFGQIVDYDKATAEVIGDYRNMATEFCLNKSKVSIHQRLVWPRRGCWSHSTTSFLRRRRVWRELAISKWKASASTCFLADLWLVFCLLAGPGPSCCLLFMNHCDCDCLFFLLTRLSW